MTTTDVSARSYSELFPPKNRINTGLGVIDIEIVDDQGAHRYDPNSAILAAHKGPKGFSLGTPVALSDISKEPGYILRFDAVQLALTAPEMVRLFMHSLRPEEFFALANKYGIFYEISGKFYDEDTGVADDPRLTFEEQDHRHTMAGVPHLLVLQGDAPSVHSIVALDQVDQLIPVLSSAFSVRAEALPLQEPQDAVRISVQATGNNVALLTFEDGSMAAYGPFDTASAAEAFALADHPEYAIMARCSASSVVATCGSAR